MSRTAKKTSLKNSKTKTKSRKHVTPRKKQRSELTPFTPRIILTPVVLNSTLEVGSLLAIKDSQIYSISISPDKKTIDLKPSKCRRSLNFDASVDNSDKFQVSKAEPYYENPCSEFILSEEKIVNKTGSLSFDIDEFSVSEVEQYKNTSSKLTSSGTKIENKIGTSSIDTELSVSEDEPYQDSGSEYIPSEEEIENRYENEHQYGTLVEMDEDSDSKLYPSAEEIKNKTGTSINTDEPPVSEADLYENSAPESILSEEEIESRYYAGNENTNTLFTSPPFNEIQEILTQKDRGQAVLTSAETGKLTDTIKVAPSRGRKSDKRQCCKYCMKLMIKLPRHLENCHADEIEVMKFIKLPPNSKERKYLIEKIRNKGNFMYNYYYETGTKHFIVKRRPAEKEVNAVEYLPCEYCLATFNRKLLYRHVTKCKNTFKAEARRKWSRVQARSQMITSIPKCTSTTINEAISCKMKIDKITEEVKRDDLILKYGAKLFLKHGHEENLYGIISTKMRELGRLVLELKNKNPKFLSLKYIFHPKNFELLIKAVHDLTGFDSSTGKFKIPSLAKKLGYSLKYCSSILLGDYIKSENVEMQKQVRNFIKIFDMDWSLEISKNALSTLYEAKWNKPDLLPLSEDIILLNKYINEKLIECEEILNKTYMYSTWNQFCKVLLSKIILFNRRRVGEAQRLKISSFQVRSMLSEDSEIYKCLTVVEKAAAKNFVHIEIKGKRGRKVPILLSTKDVSRIQIILKFRGEAGVHRSNPYVFGRHEYSVLRGSDALNYVANSCGARKPENLTSTNLRKHIATACQILNLSNNQMDYVANYLGHDIKVHRNFYRLPDNAIHLAKISKLLLTFEKGNIGQHHGKNFDDIDINFEETEEQTNVLTRENRKFKPIPSRSPWTKEEQEAVMKHLNTFIQNRIVPGLRPCTDCKNNEPEILKNRTWQHIKSWCHNQIQKKGNLIN